MNDEEKLLIYTTLKHDQVMNTYLTPGEFISSLDTCKHTGLSLEDFLCSMKVLAHRNLNKQYESILLKCLQLLDSIQKEVDQSETDHPNGHPAIESRRMSLNSYVKKNVSRSNFNKTSTADMKASWRNDRSDSNIEDGRINRKLVRLEKERKGRSLDKKEEGSSSVNESSVEMNKTDQKTLKHEYGVKHQRDQPYRIEEEDDQGDSKSNVSFEEKDERRNIQFNKTGGFKMPPRPVNSNLVDRKVVTGKTKVKFNEGRIDSGLDRERIKPPKLTNQPTAGSTVLGKNSNYRIKRTSKSSNTNRQQSTVAVPSAPVISKVSPYAQPGPNHDDRRKKLLKLMQ